MDGNRGASSAKTIGNPKKAQPNPGSIGDLIGSNIDYSLAPKRISQASPRSTTRYGANQEWTRNTSSVIVPIPNSAFYVDEKIRLENKGFVDLQSIVKKSQNAAKLAKLVPRNQCSS